jgi:hypothetical protein
MAVGTCGLLENRGRPTRLSYYVSFQATSLL